MRTLPDVTKTMKLESGTVIVDEAGYLIDPETWTEEFARHVAAEEGIDLLPAHWDVLEFMRTYNDEHGIAADARFAMKYLADKLEIDKAGSRAALFGLFPYGYVKQACKIAGMRQPRAWSTG